MVDIQVIPFDRRDTMIGSRPTFSLAAFDVGNANLTVVTPECMVTIPHAIRELTAAEISTLGDDVDENESLYFVNGVYYEVGEAANRHGAYALKFGSMRYSKEYLGVLYAILLFHGFDKAPQKLYVMANHPPRDRRYRRHIKEALVGTFTVTNMGVNKVVTINQVGCYVEPVAGYLHAIANDEGLLEVGTALRETNIYILDIGGFTSDATFVAQGKIDSSLTGSQSETYGMLDVLRDFENLVRDNNPEFFMKIQMSDNLAWRDAFQTGIYNARSLGEVTCSDEAAVVGREAVARLMDFIENHMGGMAQADGLLLSGGGGAKSALGSYFTRDFIGNAQLYYAEPNQELMHLATAIGAAKQGIMVMKNNKLWKV